MPPSVTPASDKPHRRSLPGWAVDLIVDGVDVADDARGFDVAVTRALFRTALSAKANGWTMAEWAAEVLVHRDRRMRSGPGLGEQARFRHGRRQDEARTQQRLTKAWCEAWDWAREHPASGAALAKAVTLDALRARTLAADLDADLRGPERAVLADLAGQMEARQMTRVAMPWRAVAERTGLTERATKNALASLERSGLLVLHRRGCRSTATRPGRANLYRLGAE